MTVRSVPRSDIDLFSDDVLADPYPAYQALRDAGPAVYLERLDVWALPRYADVKSAASDWQTFSSAAGIAFNDLTNQNMAGNPVALDPPEHDHLRAVLMEKLSPREIRKFVEDIEHQADDLVADLVERRTFDGIADLAVTFPARVVTHLVGLPPDASDKLVEWGEASFSACGSMNERTQTALPVVGELLGIMATLTKEQLRPDSAGCAIFEALERGDINPHQCLHLLWDYTGPGIDTTISGIGTLVWQLSQNPDQFQLLRDDPSLIPAACNEALRYDAPLQNWGRFTTREADVEGVAVPPEARVALMFGSANRDERHYPDPDRFDIRRNPEDHLAFGFGIHACIGARLARAEMQAVLSALVKHVTRIEVAQPERHLNNVVRKFANLPVTVA